MGRITRVTAPDGSFYGYQYDSRGNLWKVTDPMGKVTEYAYDAEHNLVDVKDARGIKPIKNEYDDSGRLIAHTDANGNRIEYTHALNSRQEVVKDRMGRITVYEYDDWGMVTSVTNPIGATTRSEYGEIGGGHAIGGREAPTYRVKMADIDALGNRTTYAYDRYGNMTSRTDALGHTQRWQYDENNQITAEWDALGRKTSYEYDDSGHKISQTDALGNVSRWEYNSSGWVLRELDALGNIKEYEYDASGNMLSMKQYASIGGTALVTSYTYDAMNRKLTETDPRGHTTTFEYDADGRLKKTVGPASSPGQATTSYEYDAVGQQVKTIDPLNRETENVYNDRGELVKTIYPDTTFTTTIYDAEGNRVETRDQLNRATTYYYDGANRLARTLFPDGAETRITYDILGRRIASTDAMGNVTNYEYNEVGQLTRQRDALGHEVTYEYDAAGNKIAMTDPKGNTSRYFYDALNRPVRTQFPDNSSTFTEYDALGRKTAETDQAGVRTAFEYDGLGRLTAVVGPASLPGSDPTITRYEYDASGNRTAIIDAENRRTEFEYDELNRLSLKRLPLGQTETYQYDLAGNMTSKTDFNGATLTYTYDNMNRLTREEKDAQNYETYTYTNNGKRASANMRRPGINIPLVYFYDSRDRITTIQQFAGVVDYEYDLNGNKTKTLIGHVYGTYEYDALNRLSAAVDKNGNRTEYEYDENGNRKSITYPNSTKTTYEYDSLNRLTYMENRNTTTGALITSYRYTLGPTGIRLGIEESNYSGVVATMDYDYDGLYRLTREGRTGASAYYIEYTYDKVGNRLTQDAGGVVTNYTYDNNDRLLQTQASTGNTTFTYDNNGNTISKTDSAGTINYTWDYEDRLVKTQEMWGSNRQTSYFYDVDGIRVRNNTFTDAYQYTIDYSQPYAQAIREDNSSGNINEYFFGDDLISMEIKVTGYPTTITLSYYHYDGLGSTRALTNPAGSTTDTYDYFAFGTLLASTVTTKNDRLFTGEQYDHNIGFYYLRARYMNTYVARFISSDLLGGLIREPQSIHKYVFVENNPVIMTDYSGLERKDHKNVKRWWNNLLEQSGYNTEMESWVLYRLGIQKSHSPRGVKSIRCDIAVYDIEEIWEIEPLDNKTQGRVQIDDYMRLIVSYEQGVSWSRGHTLPSQLYYDGRILQEINGITYNILLEPGLVFYKIAEENENEEPKYSKEFQWGLEAISMISNADTAIRLLKLFRTAQKAQVFDFQRFKTEVATAEQNAMLGAVGF